MHSVTAILFELGLSSCNTLVHNSRVIYRTQIANSTNDILMHFTLLGFYSIHSSFIIVFYMLYFIYLFFFFFSFQLFYMYVLCFMGPGSLK